MYVCSIKSQAKTSQYMRNKKKIDWMLRDEWMDRFRSCGGEWGKSKMYILGMRRISWILTDGSSLEPCRKQFSQNLHSRACCCQSRSSSDALDLLRDDLNQYNFRSLNQNPLNNLPEDYSCAALHGQSSCSRMCSCGQCHSCGQIQFYMFNKIED